MSVFPLLMLGLTLWMVNGSPTSNLTAESPDSSSSTRESKQILLPLPFPGQHADFHDYVVPSIQAPGYVFYNDKVQQYQPTPYENVVPVNVYPQHYGYYPYHVVPALPSGKIGFAALISLIQNLFGGGSSSSSSTTDSSSSSSSTTDSSSATDSSTDSSSTTDSSTTDSSTATDSSTTESSTATDTISRAFIRTRIPITRTAFLIPMSAIVVPTRLPY